jgi:hypothetical protein
LLVYIKHLSLDKVGLSPVLTTRIDGVMILIIDNNVQRYFRFL